MIQPISLARRTLNLPSNTNAPLPPLVSPPLATPAAPIDLDEYARVNEELYDLIALALRAYVSSWYSRVSPLDKEFIPEVNVAIVAVVTELAKRIQAADLDYLILNDIPVLVAQHYRDYRLARSKLGTSYSSSGLSSDTNTKANLARVFHNIQSHLAVSPDGQIDDTYVRQAVDHILRTCLPPQDWASEMERSIVREIIVRPVLGSILPRLSEPWFLHMIALAILGNPSVSEVSPNISNPTPFL